MWLYSHDRQLMLHGGMVLSTLFIWYIILRCARLGLVIFAEAAAVRTILLHWPWNPTIFCAHEKWILKFWWNGTVTFYAVCRATQSIGMLSFTFLRSTGHDDIVVPMVRIPHQFGCLVVDKITMSLRWQNLENYTLQLLIIILTANLSIPRYRFGLIHIHSDSRPTCTIR